MRATSSGGPGVRLGPPPGTYDALPAQARARRRLEARLRELFEMWGYQEIITPTFELDEVVAQAGLLSGRQTYRFVDREGQVIVLRPDWTPAVARVVAGRLRGATMPLRLCYVGNVFRYDRRRPDDPREFGQAGVELIGAPGALADAEVMALAWESCRRAGIAQPHLEVGHAGYVQALLGELPAELAERARQALVARDLVAYEQALASPDAKGPVVAALAALADERGGVDVVERALGRGQARGARRALEELRELLEHLAALGMGEHVAVDLGMVKDLDYYTGAVFEVYAPDGGASLATGGRYDTLLGRFGAPLPSTGFAVSLDRVLGALDAARRVEEGGARAEEAAGVVWVLGAPGCPSEAGLRRAWGLARRLRDAGVACAVDPSGMAAEDGARAGAAAGAAWVVIPEGEGEEDVRVLEGGEPGGHRWVRMTVDALIARARERRRG